MAEIKQRGFLAPLLEYDDGTVGMGVPGLLYQPYQALARLMQSGYNPGWDERTKAGAIEDAFDAAGLAVAGSLAAPMPRGSVGMGGNPFFDRLGTTEKAPGRHIIKKGGTTAQFAPLEDGGVELRHLFTDPQARGQGSARALLDDITRAADDTGTNLRLTVIPDHGVDQGRLTSLYERSGFSVVDDYFGQPVMTRGSVGMGGRPTQGSSGDFSSKMVGYDPKPLPQRPFHDDYPGNVRSDGSGRLQTGIDGVQLNAPFVAGRTMVGGGDAGILPEQFVPLAEALVGKRPVPASAAELGRDAGAFRRRVSPGADAPEYEIQFARSLEPGKASRVVGHETGHAVDEFAGQIPTDGLLSELKQVYHDLATGQQGRTTNRTAPQHLGYSSADTPREFMAEAVRAYMTDPNYLKTVAPKTAARIREYANENPRISRVIQFNANNPRAVAQVEGAKEGIRAYHGSPHDFDRFDMSKIGTGEGAQAYGHGLYFAEAEDVAKTYKLPQDLNGYDPVDMATGAMRRSKGDRVAASDDLQARLQELHKEKAGRGVFDRSDLNKEIRVIKDALTVLRSEADLPKLSDGHMYEVRINADPNDFLDWDKPLSQQSEKVRAAFAGLGITDDVPGHQLMRAVQGLKTEAPPASTGDALRDSLRAQMYELDSRTGTKRGASEPVLKDAGIPGIRYLDQGSRAAGEGSRNYVVFDDALIEILRKYGLLGALGLGAASQVEGDG